MNVIILDHFGVMCLADKHGVEHSKTDLPNVNQMRVHGKFDKFDEKAVAVLNSIITQTDVEIVVSSDWKKWCSLDEMKIFYKSQKIIKTPIDFTPNIKNVDIFNKRSSEINSWILNHKIHKWVAVDDLYLGKLLTNFVWISKTDEGITQKGIKNEIIKYII